jgi:hypothetical protein
MQTDQLSCHPVAQVIRRAKAAIKGHTVGDCDGEHCEVRVNPRPSSTRPLSRARASNAHNVRSGVQDFGQPWVGSIAVNRRLQPVHKVPDGGQRDVASESPPHAKTGRGSRTTDRARIDGADGRHLVDHRRDWRSRQYKDESETFGDEDDGCANPLGTPSCGHRRSSGWSLVGFVPHRSRGCTSSVLKSSGLLQPCVPRCLRLSR